MQLSTKYEMNQRVWSITRTGVERPPVECPACEDGHVLLRGERFQCPKCNGTRQIKASASGWVITGSGRIGQIRAELQSKVWDTSWGDGYVDHGVTHLFVHYMLDTTGIGSGSLHQEPNLFPSREEAQAECDRRNGWAGAKEAA